MMHEVFARCTFRARQIDNSGILVLHIVIGHALASKLVCLVFLFNLVDITLRFCFTTPLSWLRLGEACCSSVVNSSLTLFGLWNYFAMGLPPCFNIKYHFSILTTNMEIFYKKGRHTHANMSGLQVIPRSSTLSVHFTSYFWFCNWQIQIQFHFYPRWQPEKLCSSSGTHTHTHTERPHTIVAKQDKWNSDANLICL